MIPLALAQKYPPLSHHLSSTVREGNKSQYHQINLECPRLYGPLANVLLGPWTKEVQINKNKFINVMACRPII